MYFEKLEDGRYVLVTNPEDGKTYFDKDGNEVVAEVKSAAVHTDDNPIKELTGLIREIGGSVDAVKEKAEKNEQAMAAFLEAQKRGSFTLPDPENMTEEEIKAAYAPYDMEKQGQRLMDKFVHPTHTIDDATRVELAKWYITMVKATVIGDMRAKQALWTEWPSKDPVIEALRMRKDVGLATTDFPVPDIVEAEILAYARERSVMLQDARVVDMISDKQSYPSETAGAGVYWGDAVPAGDPTADEVELDTEELNSYSTAKEDVLMDARSDIVSWLTESMAEAAALELDDAGFNGDGSSAYGSHSGVIVAAGYSVVFDSTSTNFSAITLPDISEAIMALDGLRKIGAKFYLHGTGLHWVRMLRDDQGRPIFVDTTGNTNTLAGAGKLFGYPVQEVIKMPTTAASACFALFGNMRGFLVGRRLASTTLKVDPYGLIMTNRIRYKIYQRWALKTGLPNNFCKIVTAGS